MGEKIIHAAGTAAVLYICHVLWYVVSRIHFVSELWPGLAGWLFMRGWPFDLVVFGWVVILLAALANAKKVMVCVVIGYMAGFGLGVLFNRDYYAYRGMYNNEPIFVLVNDGWYIWTVSYLVIIVLGIAWQIIGRFRR